MCNFEMRAVRWFQPTAAMEEFATLLLQWLLPMDEVWTSTLG